MLTELMLWQDAGADLILHLSNHMIVEGSIKRVDERDNVVHVRSVYGKTDYVIPINQIAALSFPKVDE